MTALDELTDEQFERHALEVLMRELGPAGFARYLRLNRSGKGDYTADRADFQHGLTIDEIVDSVRQHSS